MILTRQYDFDIVPGGLPLLIRASHNDTSSTLVFSLFSGEGVLDIPSGATAVVQGKTANKVAAFEIIDAIPTVTVNLDKTMTGIIGLIPLEIVLSSGSYDLVTATLYLDVR